MTVSLTDCFDSQRKWLHVSHKVSYLCSLAYYLINCRFCCFLHWLIVSCFFLQDFTFCIISVAKIGSGTWVWVLFYYFPKPWLISTSQDLLWVWHDFDFFPLLFYKLVHGISLELIRKRTSECFFFFSISLGEHVLLDIMALNSWGHFGLSVFSLVCVCAYVCVRGGHLFLRFFARQFSTSLPSFVSTSGGIKWSGDMPESVCSLCHCLLCGVTFAFFFPPLLKISFFFQ